MTGRAGLLLAAALALAACDRDTAIVVEVRWDPATLAPEADALRIYVGTGAGPAFVTNPGTSAVALDGLEPPYRYLLRPGGGLRAIGELELAAAFTDGPDGDPIALAVAAPITFADGEVRTVVLEPAARPFAVGGAALECVAWADAGQGPFDRAIGGGAGDAADTDCDAALNRIDCQPFNPGITGENRDHDRAICDDCFDGDAPRTVAGWPIDPASVFPGQTEQMFRALNRIPDEVACLHIDFDCDGGCAGANTDLDESRSDRCGATEPGADPLACPTLPSDCDEGVPGHTPVFGDPEVCDGADQSCDKRPAPNLPCPIFGPGGDCTVGRRDCDDARGTFGECTPIGFAPALSPETCEFLDRVEGCDREDDPLTCAAGAHATCAVAPSAVGCPDERVQLPGVPGPIACDWRVIGGVDHAEWVIGFVDSDASTAPPRAATATCAPFLVARAVHPDPAPRTVLIVGQDATASAVVAWFVTFSAEDGTACDHTLACSDLPLM